MTFLFIPPAPLQAREDSARLLFQKSAALRDARVYVVKKGDSLGSIFRRQRGSEPVPYALIRQLNPRIRDLNRIYPGQKIVLPVRETVDFPELPVEVRKENAVPPSIYRIKEGDSISRIILSALNMKPAEALPAYRLIRQLNPEIADLNRLQVGQILRLPTPSPSPGPATAPADPPETTLDPAEKPDARTAAEKPAAADGRLGMIRPVINRMHGAVTSTGNYFIPLQQSSQITIDCSMIPVVELDDGTTLLLDYGNRLSENLKELIRQSWKNYAFLTAEELRDDLAAIQGIVRHSRDYRMAQTDKPLTLAEKPEILLFPDWLIIRNEKTGGAPYRQALFRLDRGALPFPAEVKAFIEKSGVAVTEIAGDRALSSVETPPKPKPAIVELRGLNGIAFAEKLLQTLGEAPLRNAEVAIFDEALKGFHLSITADLLLRKGEKRFILQTKRLPEQFLSILKEAGTEVIPIAENSQGRDLIETVLQGVGIPVSYGYFFFRIPDGVEHPRLTASFSALRTETKGEPFYLIDFDMPPAGMPFLRNGGGVRIGRY
jgi:LysM repeat protein